MSSCPNTDADPDVAIRYFTLGLNWAVYCCQNLSMKILLRPLADYVKNCTKKRAARLYFLAPPIKSLILWRCRGRCCRHFLNSLIINSDRVSRFGACAIFKGAKSKTSLQISNFTLFGA